MTFRELELDDIPRVVEVLTEMWLQSSKEDRLNSYGFSYDAKATARSLCEMVLHPEGLAVVGEDAIMGGYIQRAPFDGAERIAAGVAHDRCGERRPGGASRHGDALDTGTRGWLDGGRGGASWVEYEWIGPCSGEMEPKSTYVVRVGPLLVGVGAYGALRL